MDWFDLSPFLGLPQGASSHAGELDYMLSLVHWLMLILFVIWAPFFLYTLYRFRASKHPKARYEGVKSRASTYLEGGVVLAEVGLLFFFAIPVWGELRDELPDERDATVVHIVAEQFAWNVHYPGPDGAFGRRAAELVDPISNPIGLDRADPRAQDDLTTLNELFLPVDRPVVVHLSSKDVIHSFAIPVMRVKQDAIPGLVIPVWFVPTDVGEFEIACAQLCGIGHYRMRGYVTVQSAEEHEAWLQAAAEDFAL